MSRIGKAPIRITDSVKVTVQPSTVIVDGPKGSLSMPVSDLVAVDVVVFVFLIFPRNLKGIILGKEQHVIAKQR